MFLGNLHLLNQVHTQPPQKNPPHLHFHGLFRLRVRAQGLKDSDFRTVLRPLFLSEIETTEAIEVILGEGDACVV